MMTKKRQNRLSYILFACCFLCALCIALIMRREREQMKKSGKETAGMVIHKRVDRSSAPYMIDFAFFNEDSIAEGMVSLSLGEKKQYQNAVIGRTYRVRFFPDKPTKYARIYTEEPVSVSEEEYLRLLEQLFIKRQQIEKSKKWWKNF